MGRAERRGWYDRGRGGRRANGDDTPSTGGRPSTRTACGGSIKLGSTPFIKVNPIIRRHRPRREERGDQPPIWRCLRPPFPLFLWYPSTRRRRVPAPGAGEGVGLLPAGGGLERLLAGATIRIPSVETGGASTPQIGAVKYGLNRSQKGTALCARCDNYHPTSNSNDDDAEREGTTRTTLLLFCSTFPNTLLLISCRTDRRHRPARSQIRAWARSNDGARPRIVCGRGGIVCGQPLLGCWDLKPTIAQDAVGEWARRRPHRDEVRR